MTAKTFFNAAIAATCRHFASFCNTTSAASAFTSVANLLNYHLELFVEDGVYTLLLAAV